MSTRTACFENIGSSRRSFVLGTLLGTALYGLSPPKSWAATSSPDLSDIKALTFDMQGTIFDFYDPMEKTAILIARRRGLAESWAATLPGDWSTGAHDIIVDISAGRRPWMSNTDVYRAALGPLLQKLRAQRKIKDEDRSELLSVWGRMVPWDDAHAGLTQLRRKYTLCTLTNAAMAQMTALVKDNKLPFDEILTGELRHAFKPDPRVYRMAVAYTGFQPEQLLMVSAHKWDLQASKHAGFRTAFIPRPRELGPGRKEDRLSEDFIDVTANDLVDLANRLGA